MPKRGTCRSVGGITVDAASAILQCHSLSSGASNDGLPRKHYSCFLPIIYPCLVRLSASLYSAHHSGASPKAPQRRESYPAQDLYRHSAFQSIPGDIHRPSLLRFSFLVRSHSSIPSTVIGTCAVHKATGMTHPWTLAAGLSIGGMALLTEKKSRRMELTLYALSRAAESSVRCLVEWGYLKSTNRRIDVVLFSLAVAFITHCYSDDEGSHRHAFK